MWERSCGEIRAPSVPAVLDESLQNSVFSLCLLCSVMHHLGFLLVALPRICDENIFYSSAETVVKNSCSDPYANFCVVSMETHLTSSDNSTHSGRVGAGSFFCLFLPLLSAHIKASRQEAVLWKPQAASAVNNWLRLCFPTTKQP